MINLDELLQGAKTVAITGHINPDGDCIGSSLGLYNYIKDNFDNIHVDVYLQPIAEEFKFLKYSNFISQKIDDEKVYDLFFSLDGAGMDRFEPFAVYFKNAKKTVVIDHHVSGQEIGDINLIMPDYSSCSQLLYETMDSQKVSKATAECLYTGIIHDTGVFKYQQVNEKTMQVAGALMSKGIDFTSIIDKTFYMRTYRQTQVLGRALLESVLFYEGKCIFSVITKKEMEFYNVTPDDLSGIIEQLRLNDGVEVAIFIYEQAPNEYKVGLRSKKYIDVSKIARMFGGGGHVRASGFSMTASDPKDIINCISKQVELQLQ